MGRQHKQLCIEAEKAGKDSPIDPRFVDDPKKDAKKKEVKKKDPKVPSIDKAPEEVEEKEPEEKRYERGGEYMYLLLDEFEKEDTLHHLEDFEGLTFFNVTLQGLDNRQTAQPINADGRMSLTEIFLEDKSKTRPGSSATSRGDSMSTCSTQKPNLKKTKSTRNSRKSSASLDYTRPT